MPAERIPMRQGLEVAVGMRDATGCRVVFQQCGWGTTWGS
jgi:hypothetical protein